MSNDKYLMDTTFLGFKNGVVDRWVSDKTLVYYGSKDDVIDGSEGVPVIECSIELQNEYKQLIDKL